MKDTEFRALCLKNNIPTAEDFIPPSPEELKLLFKKHKLTGSQVGLLVGTTNKQIRKYTSGIQPMPYSMLYTLKAKGFDF